MVSPAIHGPRARLIGHAIHTRKQAHRDAPTNRRPALERRQTARKDTHFPLSAAPCRVVEGGYRRIFNND